MALIPRYLRPKAIIRRRAIARGLLGRSMFWKVVAAWVFGSGTIKKAIGKQPETIGRFRVDSNSFLNVINAKPIPKKERKRRGITKKAIVDQAVADVRAAKPDAGVRLVE